MTVFFHVHVHVHVCDYNVNLAVVVSQTVLSVELPIPTSSPAVVSVINTGNMYMYIDTLYVHVYNYVGSC